MSVEALWISHFRLEVPGSSPVDVGAGVTVLETERVFGGDSSFYWTGTFAVQADQLTATVKVDRHSPYLPALGNVPVPYETVLTGVIDENHMQLRGAVAGARGMELVVELTRKAELP